MSKPKISYVIFDVDDVLLEMEEPTRMAERAVEAPLAEKVGASKARAIQEGFSKGYWTLIRYLRLPPGTVDLAYNQLRARIEKWQQGLVKQGYEVKPWSRDTLLAIAMEDAGVPPTYDLVEGALTHYWNTLAANTKIYDDARAILTELRKLNIPYHLATNSDGFLRLDDEEKTFVYEPSESAARKVKRLKALTDLGVPKNSITVGDPIGKPNAPYYARVLKEFSANVGNEIEVASTLAIGDSLTSDVIPFLQAGVAHGAWLKRSEAVSLEEVREDGVHVVGGLEVVRRWLGA